MYNKHQKDLKLLKTLLKENSMDAYNKIFREMNDNNYSAYVGSVNSKKGVIRRGKKHDVTEIFKNIKKAVSECADSEIKIIS